MDAKKLYEKFRGTVGPFSDEELGFIIPYFRDLEAKINLGPRFEFASKEVRECLDTFERWQKARKDPLL